MKRAFLFLSVLGLLAGCSSERGGTSNYSEYSSGSGTSSDVGQGTRPAIQGSPSFNPGGNPEDPRSPNHFNSTPQ